MSGDNFLDLYELLPNAAFDFTQYRKCEREVLTPALEALGFKVGEWWSSDADSFGPLVRAVRVSKDGKTSIATYG